MVAERKLVLRMLSCPCSVGGGSAGWAQPPTAPRRPGPGRAHVAAAGEVVHHPGHDVVHPGQDLLPGVRGHLPIAQQGGAANPRPARVRVRLLRTGRAGRGSSPSPTPASPPGASGLCPASRQPWLRAPASPPGVSGPRVGPQGPGSRLPDHSKSRKADSHAPAPQGGGQAGATPCFQRANRLRARGPPAPAAPTRPALPGCLGT